MTFDYEDIQERRCLGFADGIGERPGVGWGRGDRNRRVNPVGYRQSSPAGVATLETNLAVMKAGGSDLGGAADQCIFAYRSLSGDFDLKVRVETLDNADLWTKAGLVARESLEPDARFAGSLATPTVGGCLFESRGIQGRAAVGSGFWPANYPFTWLRLQRQEDIVRGYAGNDGTTWRVLGTAALGTNDLYVGLAVASHRSGKLAEARFRDLGPAEDGGFAVASFDREPPGPSNRRTGLAITEIMYRPTPRADGRNGEFIELFNSESIYEDIGGYRLAGAIDYTFPASLRIQAGEILVIAKSPGDIGQIYGLEGVLGGWTGDLPDDGGVVRLLNRNGAVLWEAEYSPERPWPVAAAGGGHSLVLARPSYGEDDPKAWSASSAIGGSPGRMDPARSSPWAAVKINEILANPGVGQEDFVEFYNHGAAEVDLGGCAITDRSPVARYRFPSGTRIAGGGRLAVSRTQLGFGFKAAGETLYLMAPDLGWVVDVVSYGGQVEGSSWGRLPEGEDGWHELREPTPGEPNRERLAREVVVNEIMYHPISEDDADTYVELLNRGTQPVDLGGWRFTAGVDFTFPAGATIPAGGYVVVAKDTAKLRARYPQLTAANTFGDFGGRLSHGGERLALSMPVSVTATNAAGDPQASRYFVLVNEVTYGTGGKWGKWSDGGG